MDLLMFWETNHASKNLVHLITFFAIIFYKAEEDLPPIFTCNQPFDSAAAKSSHPCYDTMYISLEYCDNTWYF